MTQSQHFLVDECYQLCWYGSHASNVPTLQRCLRHLAGNLERSLTREAFGLHVQRVRDKVNGGFSPIYVVAVVLPLL